MTLNDKDLEELAKGNIEWFDPESWKEVVNAAKKHPILIETSKQDREIMTAALQEVSFNYTYVIQGQDKELRQLKQKIEELSKKYLGSSYMIEEDRIGIQLQKIIEPDYDPGKDIVHD